MLLDGSTFVGTIFSAGLLVASASGGERGERPLGPLRLAMAQEVHQQSGRRVVHRPLISVEVFALGGRQLSDLEALAGPDPAFDLVVAEAGLGVGADHS